MNDTIRTILNRRTERSFSEKRVDDTDLTKILDCARWAPSGSNQQPWHFVVIRDKHLINDISEVIKNEFNELLQAFPNKKYCRNIAGYERYLSFIKQAPVLIAVLGKPYQSYFQQLVEKTPYEFKPQDINDVYPASLSIGASIQNMLLAAESLGYSSCWMTGPLMFQKKLERLLEISQPWHLVSFVIIGKSGIKPAVKPNRRKLTDICTFIG